MNTLDDLRTVLGDRADDLRDDDRYLRPAAVRERIRVARRRRTATAAVVAAAAVAVTAIGVGTLRGGDAVEPASRVVGVDVPSRVSVYGFPYAVSRTLDFPAGRPRLLLSDTADDRAVSLVARGLGRGSATLYADGEPVARAFGDQDVEVPVPTAATRFRVRFDRAPASARAGVAVYDWTGELADGVADAGGKAVFRRAMGADRLLAGAFSEPGSSTVSVPFTGAFDGVRFSEYCTTDQKGLWLNVEVDHQGPISGPCREDGRDPGSASATFLGHRVRDRVVRAYVTRGAEGPVVRSASTVVGVAVYTTPSAPRVLGMRVAPSVEYGGRTWVLDSVETAPLTLDTREDVVIGLVARGAAVHADWHGRLVSGTSARLGATSGPASTLATELLAGDRYRIDVRGGQGRLLVYRPE
ncbi:hypothetical protein [Nocardioides sp.]|uniref:hypothetical protein n=1 Tax=Nocardioides sp. TaxID=35761 RepID=UPI003784022B